MAAFPTIYYYCCTCTCTYIQSNLHVHLQLRLTTNNWANQEFPMATIMSPTQPHKRQRTENEPSSSSLTIYNESDAMDMGMDGSNSNNNNSYWASSLSHPTIKLTGHTGSVYGLAYSPDGEWLASSSFDMTCLLWNTSGNCENINVLQGHKNAVLDVKWSMDRQHIATASADKTLAFWDGNTAEQRLKKLTGLQGHWNMSILWRLWCIVWMERVYTLLGLITILRHGI